MFIHEGDVVQIALHEEVLPVKSEVLRQEIEARWNAFRGRPLSGTSARARVTADGGTAAKVGWWALIVLSIAAIAFVFVQRSGLLETWDRYQRERHFEDLARRDAESERDRKRMDEDWAKWKREMDDKEAKLWAGKRAQEPAAPVEKLGPATGHRGGITWLSATPDGNRFLSASLDKTVKLWDLADSTQVRNVGVHAYPVHFVTALPDGVHALAAGDEGAIVVSALADGKVVQVLGGREHGGVGAVAVTSDGRRAISIHDKGRGNVWDITQRTLLKTLNVPGTRAVALSADGATAITGSDDGSLWLWDLEKASMLRAFEGIHKGGVYSVAVMADGTRAVSGGADDVVRIWDMTNGREVRTLSGHTGTIYSVAVSADGKRILSGSADGTARLWDADSGKELVKFDNGGRVRKVAFAGGMILTSGENFSIRSWKLNGQGDEGVCRQRDTQRSCPAGEARRAIGGSSGCAQSLRLTYLPRSYANVRYPDHSLRRLAMPLPPLTSMECTVTDGLARVVLNQPDRGNPIDGAFCRELNALATELSDRADVRAVLFTAPASISASAATSRHSVASATSSPRS